LGKLRRSTRPPLVVLLVLILSISAIVSDILLQPEW
jgi:hypothetical protein